MKKRLIEHLSGLVFVTLVLLVILLAVRKTGSPAETATETAIRELAELTFIDYENRFDRALVEEALELYYPGKSNQTKALMNGVDRFRDHEFAQDLQRSHLEQQLSGEKLASLAGMYLKFLFVYALVMIITYYGVQTLGVWRFIRRKRKGELLGAPDAQPKTIVGKSKALTFEIFRLFAYFILFSPAYVIAYAMRTRINTDTIVFLIILGVISNGMLVTYAHRFYTFLVSESRKGYVESARVKNLHDSYLFSNDVGWRRILSPVKHFDDHVLNHIYANARHQYLATIKEQASFIITGLIIIEMALNIHGYLSYELLRQMLYKNWEIVIVIIWGIYLLVKATEVLTDIWVLRENAKYENRSQ